METFVPYFPYPLILLMNAFSANMFLTYPRKAYHIEQ